MFCKYNEYLTQITEYAGLNDNNNGSYICDN